MDLGIVAPIAVTVGVGMLQGRRWARRPMYALVGGYALLGLSVVAMAVTMYLAGDPDGSLIMVLASAAAAATLVGLACFLYRPLLARRRLDGRPLPVEVAPPEEALVADRRAPYAAGEGGGLPPPA
jgi:O-antigen/teichoic acid export membrane protein